MCEFEIAYRNYTEGKINYQTVAFNSQLVTARLLQVQNLWDMVNRIH